MVLWIIFHFISCVNIYPNPCQLLLGSILTWNKLHFFFIHIIINCCALIWHGYTQKIQKFYIYIYMPNSYTFKKTYQDIASYFCNPTNQKTEAAGLFWVLPYPELQNDTLSQKQKKYSQKLILQGHRDSPGCMVPELLTKTNEWIVTKFL